MSELPIRRVALYKHGVAYFEREATVDGDQALALAFKQREVSDVLKSLTVLDLGGGTVSAVSYDSTTPVEQLLAEIALTIPDAGSFAGLVPQLKGARVAVRPTGATAAVNGTVLGVDTVDTRTPSGVTGQRRLSLLTDIGEVRTFDLYDIEFHLLDDGLKRDLDFLLRTQLASKKKDARTFTLFAQGEGSRTIRLSYVLEAPVWKATYRILLGEVAVEPHPRPLPETERVADPGPGSGSPLRFGEGPGVGLPSDGPLIQGWAVVDNTSDEDWVDVHLTLVAGLPVSFAHDLYTPRYIRRPVVEVKETTGVLPPMAEAGVEYESVDSMLMELSDADTLSAPAPPRPGGMIRARMAEPAAKRSAVSSVQAQTRERQLGDLFEYAIEKPVTVRRNQSALVPIVLKPFAGRSVLLYQKAARADNPIRCVEFENTTGLTLEGGPVTVLDGGSYVGEAMLDTLKPTEKRLVGYAVELAVRVLDTIDTHTDRVTRVTVRKGTLKAHAARVQKTTYTFNSKSDKEQVVYLDHPRDGSPWALVDTAPPHETTENYWRFRFPLPPHAVTRFVVRQQETFAQAFGVATATDDQFSAWVTAKYLDAATEKAVRDALAQRARVAAIEEQLARHADERKQIHAEQKRVRDNLGSLGDRASEKELRERFVRTLSQQEDRLEAITADEARLRGDRDAARDALNALVAALDYDGAVAG